MQRFQEIDTLRGIAIVMMVVFHFMFDLNFFGIYKIAVYEGFWLVFQRITITLFLLLVGVSLSISYARTEDQSFKNLLKKFGKRSFSLFLVSLLITAATFVYLNGNGFVAFGIINLISLSIILAVFFFGFYYLNLALGIIAIALGFVISKISLDVPIWLLPFLLPIGITPPGYYSVDYVPLFPYFGIVLIGLFLGKFFYPNGKRNFNISDKHDALSKKLVLLGENSLLIYLIHQPILIGLLMLLQYFVSI